MSKVVALKVYKPYRPSNGTEGCCFTRQGSSHGKLHPRAVSIYRQIDGTRGPWRAQG